MKDPNACKETEEVLDRWLRRARESQLSHHLMSENLGKAHTWLGAIVIATTAFSGATTIFSDLEGQSKLAIGLLTLSATILTSLQTFLKLEEKANRHHIAGAGYGKVRRKLELAGTLPPEEAFLRAKEAEIALNTLSIESPSVSKSVHSKALKRSN